MSSNPGIKLSGALIDLFNSLPPEHSLNAAEVVKLLDETNLYRFRGRRRHDAVEQVAACLKDGYVYKYAVQSRYLLQSYFRNEDE